MSLNQLSDFEMMFFNLELLLVNDGRRQIG